MEKNTNKTENKFSYEDYYGDYWKGKYEERVESKYFEKLYDRLKDKLLPDNISSLRVIDVGGGNGQFSNYLGIKNAHIADISDSGLEFAKSKFGFGTVKTSVFDLKEIPDQSYDVAYCFEVAEHLDWPSLMFASINRILTSNGVLYISVPNDPIDGVHHKKRWKFKELLEDLRKCGFEVVWADNSPRFLNKHKTGKAAVRLLVNMVHKYIPKVVKIYASKIMPDTFSYMFIAKLVKKSV